MREMTLATLIERFRPLLADDAVEIRRSWEDVFRYTLRVYPKDVLLEEFDLEELRDRLAGAGLHRPIVDGYVKRWRQLLESLDEQ